MGFNDPVLGSRVNPAICRLKMPTNTNLPAGSTAIADGCEFASPRNTGVPAVKLPAVSMVYGVKLLFPESATSTNLPLGSIVMAPGCGPLGNGEPGTAVSAPVL